MSIPVDFVLQSTRYSTVINNPVDDMFILSVSEQGICVMSTFLAVGQALAVLKTGEMLLYLTKWDLRSHVCRQSACVPVLQVT